MLVGGVGYPFFGWLAFLTPYLIFCMLLITFCRLSFREIRFERLYLGMLAIQVVGCLLAYGLFYSFSPLLGEGALICILAPTAMAAAVITGMLGGNVAFTATYTLFSNLSIALFAPLFFSVIGTHSDLPFANSFVLIGRQVIPLLVIPLLGAFALERFLPGWHRKIKDYQHLTFYMWTLGLAMVSGKTVSFVIEQGSQSLSVEIGLAAAALVICILQFVLGRYLGRRYGDTVATGQALGQKNTVLAIWMAQVYLHPLAAIAPAAYVLWQNSINSWQLWREGVKNKITD